MSKIIVYGIKNCDTMKKTFDYLNNHGISYEFHDYKKLGIKKSVLQKWLKKTTLDLLVNKKGTTYRNLPIELQNTCSKKAGAIEVMVQYPSLIKRPVIESESALVVGFDPERMQHILNHEKA